MLPEVDYLRHRITKEGIKPMDKKVRAITQARTPNNVFELRSFLGLLIFTVNSYQTFLLFSVPDLYVTP